MKLRHIVCAGVLVAVAQSAGVVSAQVKERSLKVGIGLNEDHPQGAAVKRFGEILAQKSGGTLTAKLFAGGALGNDATMISALRGGTQEMTVPDSSTLVGLVKDFGVLNFPLHFNTEQEADALLDGPFGKKLLASCPTRTSSASRSGRTASATSPTAAGRSTTAERHRRPEDTRDPEPAVHRHLQHARRQRPADAVSRAVYGARAEDGRRPGEPDRDHPEQQVLRSAEEPGAHRGTSTASGCCCCRRRPGTPCRPTKRRRCRRRRARRRSSSARPSASTATRRSAS